MCHKCIIFTYDETLGIMEKLEVGAPLSFSPDWPVQTTEAFPKSIVPLIIPEFDTAFPAPAFEPGSLSVRELSWGFEESWKPGVVFNTRIESALKPTWQESMLHRRCVLPVHTFFETHREETCLSPRTGKPIKQPYEFRAPGQDIMLVGCTWRDNTFSMITTEANADMAPIHHRMPLIIHPEELPIWLGSNYQQLANRSAIRLEAQPA